MDKGLIIVVSGPSGVGKGTVNKRLINTSKNLDTAISASTRAPRPLEVHGVDYYFVSTQEFQTKVDNEEFIEYANVHGNLYGTLLCEVEQRIQKGRDVILEIDVQGGATIREKLPECVSVFLLPPSLDELTSRLTGRATDTKEAIQDRLETAIREIGCMQHYDYAVVNTDVEACTRMIKTIIKAERQRVTRKKDYVTTLLNGGNIL